MPYPPSRDGGGGNPPSSGAVGGQRGGGPGRLKNMSGTSFPHLHLPNSQQEFSKRGKGAARSRAALFVFRGEFFPAYLPCWARRATGGKENAKSIKAHRLSRGQKETFPARRFPDWAPPPRLFGSGAEEDRNSEAGVASGKALRKISTAHLVAVRDSNSLAKGNHRGNPTLWKSRQV